MERKCDWKSTVDPTTGRTYWYHRKTRATTWTKPDFIEDQQSLSTFLNGEEEFSTPFIEREPRKIDAQDLNHYGKVANGSKFSKAPLTIEKELLSKKEGFVRENNQIRFIPFTKNSDSIHDAASNDLNCAAIREFSKLLSQKDNGLAELLCKDSSVISDLISFLCSNKLTSTLRNLSLKVFFYASRRRTLTALIFARNQSWLSLPLQIDHWQDSESVLFITAFYCNLCVGPTSAMITSEDLNCLSARIGTVFNQLLEEFSNSGKRRVESLLTSELICFLETSFLNQCAILSSNGYAMAGILIAVLSLYSVQAEARLASAIKADIIASLQRVCISKSLADDVRDKARCCLQILMKYSAFARNTIMDAFLQISSDMAVIPIPTSINPSLYVSEGLEEDTLEELLQTGNCEVKNIAPNADCFESLHRDVEWIPSSGTSWLLTSSLLWCRCPALRDLIEDFWKQGGGVLELSVEASDETVSSISHYVFFGLLSMPLYLANQLELLRVSMELGMTELCSEIQAALILRLSDDVVQDISVSAATLSLPKLSYACDRFMSGTLEPTLILDSPHKKDADSALKYSILESLQEVGALLEPSILASDRTATEAIERDKLQSTFEERERLFEQYIAEDSLALNPYEETESFYDEYSERYNLKRDADKKATSSKMKPGGIYTALLAENDIGHGTRIAVAPTSQNRVPGKMPITNTPKSLTPQKKMNNHSNNKLTTAAPGLQEYSAIMSLEPQKPKSEVEKKWEDMSRPKHSREPTRRSQKLEMSDAQTDSKADSKSEIGAQEEISVGMSMKPNKSVQKVPYPSAPLKDENSAVIQEDLNVRSSLALLKAKTPKARRRSYAPSQANKDVSLQEEVDRDNFAPSLQDSSLLSQSKFTPNNFQSDAKSSAANSQSRHQFSKADFDDNKSDDRYEFENADNVPQVSEKTAVDSDANDDYSDHDNDDDDDDDDGFEYGDGNNKLQCPDCGRFFASEPFAKHAKVCKKVFLSKRRVFDSSKQRALEAPDKPSQSIKNSKSASAAKSSKWKEQSRAFRDAMRAARGAVSGAADAEVGAVAEKVPYVDPTLIQCPNCMRRFNDKAAERHIPLCKNIIAKPSSLKKGSGHSASSVAPKPTTLPSSSSKRGWQ